jgi:hypothetical protein
VPRYVVLEHDHPELHWDLMLQVGAALKTWRLPQPPAPGRSMPALSLPDHRLDYLEYEGPVSGKRGAVIRCAGGVYQWAEGGEIGQDRAVIILFGRTQNLRLEMLPGEPWTMAFGDG